MSVNEYILSGIGMVISLHWEKILGMVEIFS